MKRWTKTLLTAAVLTISAGSAIVADAGCHGRSGGSSGGYNHGSMSYSRVASYPYPSNSYPQPVYVQPPQQVIYSQQGVQMAAPPQYLSPYGGVTVSSPTGQVNGIAGNSTQFAQSQPTFQQPMPQQQIGQPQLSQPQLSQPQPGQSQISQPQIAQQQFPQQQSLQAVQQPAVQQPVASGNSAELSALQALGAFAPPQAAESQPQSTASVTTVVSQPIVGVWTARLPNGATVQLNLQADGNFNWAATNAAGSTTSFQGQYSIENGSLVLDRSSDNQRLTGSTTMSGTDSFSFKLSASNAASLEFRRS